MSIFACTSQVPSDAAVCSNPWVPCVWDGTPLTGFTHHKYGLHSAIWLNTRSWFPFAEQRTYILFSPNRSSCCFLVLTASVWRHAASPTSYSPAFPSLGFFLHAHVFPRPESTAWMVSWFPTREPVPNTVSTRTRPFLIDLRCHVLQTQFLSVPGLCFCVRTHLEGTGWRGSGKGTESLCGGCSLVLATWLTLHPSAAGRQASLCPSARTHTQGFPINCCAHWVLSVEFWDC